MMKSMSSAICALALSVVLIGQTVAVPASRAAEAATVTAQAYVGAVA